MWTVKEVAAHLRTTEVTVRRWLWAGKLKGYRPGGTKFGWRIPESEVMRLFAPESGPPPVQKGAEE